MLTPKQQKLIAKVKPKFYDNYLTEKTLLLRAGFFNSMN